MARIPAPVAHGPRIIGMQTPAAAIPGGGMTLDALMQRAEDLRRARGPQMPEMMTSPLQGLSYALQQGLAGFQQGRADRQATEGRTALAQAMSHIDPTTGQIAPEDRTTFAALDPASYMQMTRDAITAAREGRIAEQKHGWDIEGREDEQAAAAALAKQQQDAAAGQNELTRKAELERLGITEGGADRRNTADITSRETLQGQEIGSREKIAEADRQAQNDRLITELRARQDQAGLEAALGDEAAKINLAFKNGLITDAERQARMTKVNAIGGTQRTITVGPDGQLTIAEGPAGAGAAGSNQDVKNQANTLDDYRKGAAAASAVMPTIDIMQKAIDTAGPTGPLGPAAAWVGDLAESGGVKVPGLGSSGSRALLNSGALGFIQKQVAASKGSISNFEEQLFAKASPGLLQTYEGNQVLLNMSRAVAQRDQQKAVMAEQYAASHGGSLAGFEGEWANYVNNNPLLSVDPSKPGGFSVGGAPAAPASPAAPATAPAAPAAGGGGAEVQEGTTATGPNGQKIILRNGQWVPL
jgi:hypothetical protein